jgi:hypothetical protein
MRMKMNTTMTTMRMSVRVVAVAVED